MYAFLKEVLRRRDYSFFWIDTLCIDQQSIAERNHQVRWMSEIYRGASRVVVWLNDPKIAGMFQVLEQNPHVLDNARDRENFFVTNRASLTMLNAVFFNEYWSRAWIMQEFVLAKDIGFWSGDYDLNEIDFQSLAQDWLRMSWRYTYQCSRLQTSLRLKRKH